MRTHRSTTILSVCLFLLFSAGAITAWGQTQQRPIELADIMAWKGISGTALSENGEWFAYRLGPAEGDSEVIIRQTKGDKEFKFSVGEVPQPPAVFGPGDLANLPVTGPAVAFSSDGKYAVFTMFPSRSEAAQLKKQRKPLQNRVGIVNLGTGEKIEIAAIARQAMHANHDALTRRVAPVGVVDFVEPVGAQAEQVIGSHWNAPSVKW